MKKAMKTRNASATALGGIAECRMPHIPIAVASDLDVDADSFPETHDMPEETLTRAFIHALGASAIVSLSSLAPALVALARVVGVRVNFDALAQCAIGAMSAEVFVRILPMAYENARAMEGEYGNVVAASSAFAAVLAFWALERETRARGSLGHANKRKVNKGKGRKEIASSGTLNLVADGVHNFTDGAAIARAFARGGVAQGWGVALAILAHEFPQELGDYGMLKHAGFTDFEALGLNLLSASTAIVGTATTFAAFARSSAGEGELDSTALAWSCAIEAFVAGGFLAVVFSALADLARAPGETKGEKSRSALSFSATPIRAIVGFVASIALDRAFHAHASAHHESAFHAHAH